MFHQFPYSNLHDQNYDWIIKTIGEFKEKYTDFDSAVNEAIAIIEAQGDAEAHNLETLTETLKGVVEAAETLALSNIESQKNDSISAVQNAQNTASTAITEQTSLAIANYLSMAHIYENRLSTIIAELPADDASLLSKVLLLSKVVSGNVTQSMTWFFTAYEDGQVPDQTGILSASEISSYAILGAAGLQISISFQEGQQTDKYIKGAKWYTGYDDQNEKYTGLTNVTFQNTPRSVRLAVPDTCYAFSIVLGTSNTDFDSIIPSVSAFWYTPDELRFEELEDEVDKLKSALSVSTDVQGELNKYFDYYYNLVWTPGSLIKTADGELVSSALGAYTQDYYPVKAGDIIKTNLKCDGGACISAFYNAEMEFISGVENSTYIVKDVSVPNNDNIRYVRFSAERYQQTNYTEAPFALHKRSNNIDAITRANMLADMLDKVVGYDYPIVLTAGKLIKLDGNLVDNTNGAYTADYYPIQAGSAIRTNYKATGVSGIAYYDEDKRFISGVELSGYTVKTATVPNNSAIKYARFSLENYQSSSYSVTPFVQHIAPSELLQIGNLTDLGTTDKSNIVAAINEILNSSPSGVTIVDNLNSTDVAKALSAKQGYVLHNYDTYKKYTAKDNKLYVGKDFSLTSSGWNALNSSISNSNSKLVMTCANDNRRHTAYINLSSAPINLSHAFIGIDFDVNAGTSGQTNYYDEIEEIDIVLSDQNSYGDLSATYFPVVVNSSYILYSGNYKQSVTLDIQRGHGSNSIDLTAVKFIGIVIMTKEHSGSYTGTPSITINKLFAYNYPRKAQVVIGFDGAYSEQMTAAEYMNGLGLRGTFYAPCDVIGNTGRMTLTNLYALKANRNLIANYADKATTPYYYWYQMSIQQKSEAIQYQAKWLYANGFGDGAPYVSVPGGGWAADEESLYTSGLVKWITGRIQPNALHTPNGFYGEHNTGHTTGPAGTNANRFTAIDSLCKTGGNAIFIFHQCASASADDISLDDFKAFADYVKAKKDAGLLEDVTANELGEYTLAYPPEIT